MTTVVMYIIPKLMADVSNLSTAFSKFAGDFQNFKNDFTAFMGTLPKPEDPAVQQAIDGFTAKVGEIDQNVQDMDASLKATNPQPPAQ